MPNTVHAHPRIACALSTCPVLVRRLENDVIWLCTAVHLRTHMKNKSSNAKQLPAQSTRGLSATRSRLFRGVEQTTPSPKTARQCATTCADNQRNHETQPNKLFQHVQLDEHSRGHRVAHSAAHLEHCPAFLTLCLIFEITLKILAPRHSSFTDAMHILQTT